MTDTQPLLQTLKEKAEATGERVDVNNFIDQVHQIWWLEELFEFDATDLA